MLNLWQALVITLILAVSWLRLNDYIAHRGWISGPTSRKIIHIGTGPIFVLCWLFFPDEALAKYLAAVIPLLISVQFFLVGMGYIKDQAAVDAMTRRGDRREILRGPLIYGIAFVVITLIYWKESPTGITALMMLSGGDGLADIIGKRYGKLRLPWSMNKSWAGSGAMFFGGAGFALIVLFLFHLSGEFSSPMIAYVIPVILVGLVCTAIESMPMEEYDNITVPIVALLLGHWLLPKG
ncbi:MAG: phosphatidate cytidylyltransferase [Leptolinea sp.]|nr:phosphatidate cytidylyltransferase [Leptolinea sp.]